METVAIQLEELLSHEAWLSALVRRLVDESLAEDVVQNTFLRALQRPPRKREALRAWLARVARNLALEHLRSERNEALPATEDLVQRMALQATLARAVMSLHEPYRSTVLLHHVHGFSVSEVAERTGASESNVRQRCKRGLDRWRDELADDYGEGWRGHPAVVAL